MSQKGPTCKLSVTLSNLNRFSKFLHCWKAYNIRYKINTTLPTSPHPPHHLTLPHLFCRYSTDMKENANKLHFKCTNFNSSTRVNRVYLCVNRIFKLENVSTANALQLEAGRRRAVPIRFNTSLVTSLKSLSLSVAVLERIYCLYVTLRCDLEL